LADGSSVTAAAEGIGISRAALYKARDHDPEFGALWDEAVESGTDALEDEAVKRAKNSSDTLLIFLLKGRRPEKFKERFAAEHSGKITHLSADWSKLSSDELRFMLELCDKAAGPSE
jgi:hypothetical protein